MKSPASTAIVTVTTLRKSSAKSLGSGLSDTQAVKTLRHGEECGTAIRYLWAAPTPSM